MALHNSFAERQSQPGSALLFGGEEWLEYATLVLGGNSVPVVGNEEVDFILSFSNAKGQRPFNWQRVERILDQIAEDLEHLAPVDLGVDRWGKVLHHMDLIG